MNSRRYVTVPVTTLWTSPTAPRDVDAAALAPQPDVFAWLADLDAADARLGLHGLVLTQLELGEPVDITGASADEGWLRIVAPMQPSSLDVRGYPGWVRAAHLGAPPSDHPAVSTAADTWTPVAGAEDFIGSARKHVGLPYLWGGMCDAGLDCSGLVHLSLRRLGVVFPRDADDQYDACEQIPAASARPGDLFFFAHAGKRPHHVGIVTGPGRMLHAPETGSRVIEQDLTPVRQSSLIGAGRLSSLEARPGPTG